MNKPNQKPSSTTASPSAAQKPAQKPAPKPVAKSSTGKAPVGAPAKVSDAPMHAAKGNDDTMSQPQAGKKSS